jgi:SAM-dependent methyltransferase
MTQDSPNPEFSERMVPERAGGRTFWEHISRYRFAREFVKGKRVLDIACGEGYGAAALVRAGARSVIGIDLSGEVCAQARSKYGIDARPGDAQAIPLPDRSVDLVVSFETIEHVADPAAFLGECARVLVSEGTLIVSTPNRPVYSGLDHQNPFHVIEFNEHDFIRLIRSRFETVRLFSQFPRSAAWWNPRSLAAERSPWLRIKGFWRLSSWFCPAIRTEVPRAVRDSAPEAILRSDTFLSSLFNPYLVRPRSASSGEQPYYWIAVARSVKR